MDEHTSHELAYKKGYDKGYNKGYADASEYAMSVIDDIKRGVDAILKNVQAVQRLAKQEPKPPTTCHMTSKQQPPKGERSVEKDCNNCRFEHYRADEIPCIDCGVDDRKYWKPKPITNADRIRAMTDEELAKFLYACEFCNICEEVCENCRYNGDCERRLADWLQQPAEGDA